jgi:hypothetical protein
MDIRVYGRVLILIVLLVAAAVFSWPHRDGSPRAEATGARPLALAPGPDNQTKSRARNEGPRAPLPPNAPPSTLPAAERSASAPSPDVSVATPAAAPEHSPAGPESAASGEPKPVPTLAHVERFLKNPQHPVTQALAKRMHDLESEPEDGWSQDTEARLRSFVASQPEAGQIETAITCRASQCVVQISDLQKPLSTPPPSQKIFYRLLQQSWFPLLLQHDESQFLAIEGRPTMIGWFERAR